MQIYGIYSFIVHECYVIKILFYMQKCCHLQVLPHSKRNLVRITIVFVFICLQVNNYVGEKSVKVQQSLKIAVKCATRNTLYYLYEICVNMLQNYFQSNYIF